ncbi:MAG: protein-glutamate O-methyltransferase CheR [Deltaproteobacteria bacterium]|jgi:chemotaxis protein methyltransferase CheR|nr:protein-glutamate O-methyltransferase CheR [Deltaproteobacteria bacterium]MBT4526157.1 protein-glutamate O-methyltransferase CheR [Deltaproteobacteria bacterium]
MIEELKPQEFVKIRDLLVSVCGIVLNDDQDYLVETRLTEMAHEVGVNNFGQLHDVISKDKSLLTRVVDLMTTNETLWFRDQSCWVTLKEVIVPHLIEKLEKGQFNVKIWSAASSTGQESYSLLILIKELLAQKNQSEYFNRFSIVGTDISNEVIFLAKRGIYDPFTISRGMSEERLNKYFTKERKSYKINEEIKSRVEFKNFNLMDSFIPLGKFDLVLCRNVAIYFSGEFKKELFEKISRALVPDGFMMLGATESLIGIDNNFKNLSHGNGLYYNLG